MVQIPAKTSRNNVNKTTNVKYFSRRHPIAKIVGKKFYHANKIVMKSHEKSNQSFNISIKVYPKSLTDKIDASTLVLGVRSLGCNRK